MLMINAYLAPSTVHGIGLFAKEYIPAGSVIWKFHSYIDKILSREKFLNICKTLDNFTLSHFLCATYKRNGNYFYITDNARFINHSEQGYNILFRDDYTEIAVRDIHAEEELLENYFISYDPNDFFCLEMKTQSSTQYLSLIESEQKCNAYNKNLS